MQKSGGDWHDHERGSQLVGLLRSRSTEKAKTQSLLTLTATISVSAKSAKELGPDLLRFVSSTLNEDEVSYELLLRCCKILSALWESSESAAETMGEVRRGIYELALKLVDPNMKWPAAAEDEGEFQQARSEVIANLREWAAEVLEVLGELSPREAPAVKNMTLMTDLDDVALTTPLKKSQDTSYRRIEIASPVHSANPSAQRFLFVDDHIDGRKCGRKACRVCSEEASAGQFISSSRLESEDPIVKRADRFIEEEEERRKRHKKRTAALQSLEPGPEQLPQSLLREGQHEEVAPSSTVYTSKKSQRRNPVPSSAPIVVSDTSSSSDEEDKGRRNRLPVVQAKDKSKPGGSSQRRRGRKEKKSKAKKEKKAEETRATSQPDEVAKEVELQFDLACAALPAPPDVSAFLRLDPTKDSADTSSSAPVTARQHRFPDRSTATSVPLTSRSHQPEERTARRRRRRSPSSETQRQSRPSGSPGSKKKGHSSPPLNKGVSKVYLENMHGSGRGKKKGASLRLDVEAVRNNNQEHDGAQSDSTSQLISHTARTAPTTPMIGVKGLLRGSRRHPHVSSTGHVPGTAASIIGRPDDVVPESDYILDLYDRYQTSRQQQDFLNLSRIDHPQERMERMHRMWASDPSLLSSLMARECGTEGLPVTPKTGGQYRTRASSFRKLSFMEEQERFVAQAGLGGRRGGAFSPVLEGVEESASPVLMSGRGGKSQSPSRPASAATMYQRRKDKERAAQRAPSQGIHAEEKQKGREGNRRRLRRSKTKSGRLGWTTSDAGRMARSVYTPAMANYFARMKAQEEKRKKLEAKDEEKRRRAEAWRQSHLEKTQKLVEEFNRIRMELWETGYPASIEEIKAAARDSLGWEKSGAYARVLANAHEYAQESKKEKGERKRRSPSRPATAPAGREPRAKKESFAEELDRMLTKVEEESKTQQKEGDKKASGEGEGEHKEPRIRSRRQSQGDGVLDISLSSSEASGSGTGGKPEEDGRDGAEVATKKEEEEVGEDGDVGKKGDGEETKAGREEKAEEEVGASTAADRDSPVASHESKQESEQDPSVSAHGETSHHVAKKEGEEESSVQQSSKEEEGKVENSEVVVKAEVQGEGEREKANKEEESQAQLSSKEEEEEKAESTAAVVVEAGAQSQEETKREGESQVQERSTEDEGRTESTSVVVEAEAQSQGGERKKESSAEPED